jgi:UDP-N-acetyl-D-glucosamine dehydrogenase
VIGLLQKKGAQVEYHDPYIPVLRTHDDVEMRSVSDLMAAVRASDVVVIVTNHKGYDYKSILAEAKYIFDSRNALGKLGKNHPKVERL